MNEIIIPSRPPKETYKTNVKNSGGADINPSTSEKQDSIISAIKPYKSKMIYENDVLTYYGKADAGAATSSAVWQIKKFTYVNGQMSEILLANGTTNFTNIMDNYASYSYS